MPLEPEIEPSSRTRSSLSPLALLGILAFGFILVHMSKKWKKPGAAEKRPKDDHNPTAYCKYDPASVQTVAIQENPNSEQWKTYQKSFWGKQLQCARRLNIITAIGVLFTGVAAGGALVYAGIAYKQWQQAAQALKIQQRPWIGVSYPASGIVGAEGGYVVVHGHVALKNFGLSPGLSVYPEIVPSPTLEKLEEKMKVSCDSAQDLFEHGYSRTVTTPLATGVSIFPGQEYAMDYTTAMNLSEYVPKSSIMLAGCLFYKDQWERRHRTEFCLFAPVGDVNHVFNPCPWHNEAE